MKDLYDNNAVKVSSAMAEVFKDEQEYKKSWGRVAKRCVAFANGDQMGDSASRAVMVDHNPVVSPGDSRKIMYQTNEIAPVVRTITSYMTRSKPSVSAMMQNRTPKSKNIAKIAEKIHEAKYDLDKEYKHSRKSAFWAVTTGTVFSKNWWDYTLGDYTAKIDSEGNPVIDEMGEEVIDERKSGDNNVATLTALSITLDHSVTDFESQPYIIESYIMDLEWAKEAFDQDAPGYTGKAQEIKEENCVEDAINALEDMKFSIPYVGTSTRPKSKGKTLVQELYLPPNRDFPKGRMAIKAGGVIVYISDPETGSPYFMPYDPTMWHPYDCFIYEDYTGRFLGRGLVEQLVPLQMRLNEINGSILENANTMAKPNLMSAEGQLKKGVFNGNGANVYTYKNIPGVSAPFVLEGAPLPSQFFNERQGLIDQIVRIAGTNFVMQGQPPTGVSAASAIDQLLENANTQHSDMMNSWTTYHADKFTKKLRLIHKFNVLPNKRLNGYLNVICEGELQTSLADFVGARDLSDGINIKIEEGSMIPKSQKAKNASYQSLAEGGFLHPALGEDSPRGEKLRSEMMEKMELEPLESEESSDFKKAKWENDRIFQGQEPLLSEFDIAAIHIPCHIALFQDPKFIEEATDEQKSALYDHIQAHKQQEAEKAQQEALSAQPPQEPMMNPSMQGPPQMSPDQGAMVQ